MKTKFGLLFAERDDGTKVWSAECQDCGTVLVGERYPQVTVLRVDKSLPPAQFEQLKRMAADAWKRARETGSPVVVMGHTIEVDAVPDNGDMQRALEAHASGCPARRELQRPEPTSMPGPGEPRR